MAFFDLDSQHFYRQPSTNAGLADKKRLIASNTNVPTMGREKTTAAVITSRNESSATLEEYDLIEMLDMTAPSEKKLLNSFHEPASDLKDIEAAVEGKVQHPLVFVDDE